jgi:Transposase DDE domain
MAIADRHGLPVAVHVESATPHEVTLVKATIAQKLVLKRPEHLVGDAAYESDQLDAELAQRGIELIAPHRRDRKRKTQDGRPLRRYPAAVESGTSIRVASEQPTHRRALRASRRELSGNVAPRLLPHPAAAFMRRLLARLPSRLNRGTPRSYAYCSMPVAIHRSVTRSMTAMPLDGRSSSRNRRLSSC